MPLRLAFERGFEAAPEPALFRVPAVGRLEIDGRVSNIEVIEIQGLRRQLSQYTEEAFPLSAAAALPFDVVQPELESPVRPRFKVKAEGRKNVELLNASLA